MLTRWREDSREQRYWRDLLALFGVPGVRVREVTRGDGELRVRFRSRAGTGNLQDLAGRIAVHKRLPSGAVRIGEDPAAGGRGSVIRIPDLRG